MVTGGLSEQSLTDNIKLRDSYMYNPLRDASIWVISYASWFIANFVLKFAIFRHHGNKGWSEHSLADTIKSGNTQNPLFGASIWAISLTPAEL